MKITHILETAIYCKDLDAAEKFYCQVLGLEVYTRSENRHIFFKLKNGMLLIFNPEITAQSGQTVPSHGALGAGHVAFAISETQFEKWREKLEQLDIPIEKEITWPNGGRSLYFRDPGGNSIELVTPNIWGFPEEAFGM